MSLLPPNPRSQNEKLTRPTRRAEACTRTHTRRETATATAVPRRHEQDCAARTRLCRPYEGPRQRASLLFLFDCFLLTFSILPVLLAPDDARVRAG